MSRRRPRARALSRGHLVEDQRAAANQGVIDLGRRPLVSGRGEQGRIEGLLVVRRRSGALEAARAGRLPSAGRWSGRCARRAGRRRARVGGVPKRRERLRQPRLSFGDSGVRGTEQRQAQRDDALVRGARPDGSPLLRLDACPGSQQAPAVKPRVISASSQMLTARADNASARAVDPKTGQVLETDRSGSWRRACVVAPGSARDPQGARPSVGRRPREVGPGWQGCRAEPGTGPTRRTG